MLNKASQRLLMLGLDAADLHFIRSHADALPTLGKALDTGVLFEPAAPEPLSGSVWPTFYSGKHPGMHGMYQHLVWDADRMGLRLIGDDWCPYEPFWKDLENYGHRVVVMDVPFSFGTALQKGVEITDWGTHGQTYPFRCNQPEIEAHIRRFGRSPIGRETPIKKTPRQLATIRRRLIKGAEKKADLIRQLMAALEWDLFIAVFGETHRGGHLFFDEPDGADNNACAGHSPMLAVYQAVDRALADILKQTASNTAVMIFSVHGMTHNEAQEHVAAPMMNRLNAAFLRDYCNHEVPGRQSSGGMVGALRRIVPARIQHMVGSAAPDRIRQWVVEQEVIGGLDWSVTPGFSLRSDIRTEFRLNLIGREAKGYLERGSEMHRRYVDFLRTAFISLTDADSGVRLVEEMVDIHAQFPGPLVDRLPDYAITWCKVPAARRIHAPGIGHLDVSRPAIRGGDHTYSGFALLLNSRQDGPSHLPPLASTADFAGFVSALLGNTTPVRQ